MPPHSSGGSSPLAGGGAGRRAPHRGVGEGRPGPTRHCASRALRRSAPQRREEAAGGLTPRAPEGGRERGRPGPPPSPGREGPPSPSSGSPGPLARCRWTCVRDHVHHRDVFVMAAVGPGGAAVRARVSRPARRGHRRRRARRAIRSWHAPSHMGGGGRLPASPSPKLSPRKHRGPSPHPRPGRAGPPPSLSFSHSLGEGSHSSCGSSPPTGVGRRPAGPTRRCLVPRPRRGSSDSGTTA